MFNSLRKHSYEPKNRRKQMHSMQKHLSKLLFGVIILLPILLLSSMALFGGSAPLEGRTMTNVEFLENSENDLEVVFFGYVGCTYICPTSLFKIGEAIDEIKATYPDAKVGGHFVDVNAETQIHRTNEYSSSFSKSIQGVSVDHETLNDLRGDFGLNIFEMNREIDPIIHTDHFFIMEKEPDGWTVARVLANESDKNIIKQAIEEERED